MKRREKETVTIEMAIARLMEAGLKWAAEKLISFRNVDGNKGGWDGYARAEFNSNVLRVIWPNGY